MSDARLGATPSEWSLWQSLSERDLLPVVCRAGEPLSPQSVLKHYGKVPSRYYFGHTGRTVGGIKEWTQYEANGHDIETWRGQEDYGICLQTRAIRAIDIDIEDRVAAEEVVEEIHRVLGLTNSRLPIRTRENSGKCLLLVHVEGPQPKRVLTTDNGLIEFLGDGNQCVVAGTHPSGARYHWLFDNVDRIPTMTREQYAILMRELTRIFGRGEDALSGAKTKAAGSGTSIPSGPDPVVTYLAHTGSRLIQQTGNKAYVVCPWQADHGKQDADMTQTVWFKSGTNGFECGHFQCLDAVCATRSNNDFLDAIGYLVSGFQDEPDAGPRASRASREEDASLRAFGVSVGQVLPGSDTVGGPDSIVGGFRPGTLSVKDGHYQPIPENLMAALRRHDITGLRVRFDHFLQLTTIEIAEGPRRTARRPLADDDMVHIGICLSKNRIDPKMNSSTLRECVNAAAHEDSYDYAQEWLGSLHWDGIPRIDDFYRRALGVADSPRARADSRYLWTALAGRVLDPGCQCDMAPIWIGVQGSGKTSALRAMVPEDRFYTEIHFDDPDAETAKKVQGKLIAELSELRGLRSRGADNIKAFMTRTHDEYRQVYARSFSQPPRRFIMVGTTNEEDFLSDTTGNRRYLPQIVGKQDRDYITEVRGQLWAEGAARYLCSGVAWEEAETLARAELGHYMAENTLVEPIDKFLRNLELGHGGIVLPEHLTTGYIIEQCLRTELVKASAATPHKVGEAMRILGYKKTRARVALGWPSGSPGSPDGCLGGRAMVWVKVTPGGVA